MGYLLKEALKTLCGVNQWTYAVFWKIGCQNPMLLVWEESYHAPLSSSSVAGISSGESSRLPFGEWEQCLVSNVPENTRAGSLAEDMVPSLMNKMLLASRVKIIGQGLVGRAAFSGNHMWILSDNYTTETHPSEVENEVFEQFSASIKTLAVIPIYSHGVVQFGSSSAIIENLAFVNDVKNLLLQVGFVPGALLSDNYIPRELLPNFGLPQFHNESNLSVTHVLANPHVTFSSLQTPKMASNIIQLQDDISKINSIPISLPSSNHFGNNRGKGVEVIPSNPEPWLNHHSSSNNQRSGFDGKQPFIGERILSDSFLQEYGIDGMSSSDCIISQLATSSGIPLHRLEGDNLLTSLLDPTLDMPSSTPVISGPNNTSGSKDARMKGKVEDDLTECVFGYNRLIQNNMFANQSSIAGSSSGDDLFDILGSDFRSKLFGDSLNDLVNSGSRSSSGKSQKNVFTPEYHQDDDSNLYYVKESTDHLLDAVVSKLNSSCVSSHTTLTNVSSSSVAKASLSVGKLAGIGSESFKSEKEDNGNFSRSSSLYGSQVSSWVEQGLPSGKQYSGGSKSADETGKSNKKRLKPGESPRPRPKDRQMIQDRMKELREIVPNGSKLSIDALLERTIKHMLFLQSVTKHADKLKHSGESKIINKDGGLVLRDGFEGGRTWACEVGSRNMLCPIIVEDLNQPRQMLIEMLCEDRGLFLEIADIIRGMGLTILKGVMEKQNNKIWAQFVVEADRDVTRMEIFLSLVHLFEQTIKSIPSPCTGIDSSSISLHQVASIPATGRPSTLQ